MACGSKYRTARIATTETHFFVRLDIIIEIMRHFIETEWQRFWHFPSTAWIAEGKSVKFNILNI